MKQTKNLQLVSDMNYSILISIQPMLHVILLYSWGRCTTYTKLCVLPNFILYTPKNKPGNAMDWAAWQSLDNHTVKWLWRKLKTVYWITLAWWINSTVLNLNRSGRLGPKHPIPSCCLMLQISKSWFWPLSGLVLDCFCCQLVHRELR